MKQSDQAGSADSLHARDPAVEPLKNILGYLTEVVRLDERVVERVGDHQLASGHRLLLHQHELCGLPGIGVDKFDDDGPIWLSVERLNRIDPPPIDADLESWVTISGDPEHPPVISDSVLITVGAGHKDDLIKTGQARNEDCGPVLNPQGLADHWDVRLRLDDRPDVEARLRGYLTGPLASWAAAEIPRRKTMAVYKRLFEIGQLADLGGTDRSFELVWGIGVARWRREGLDIDVPVLERLVEIEVLENLGAEIRIRPRAVGAIANLRPFEQLSRGGVQLALDAARRHLEAIERDGEVSPFVPDSFEPILNAVHSQLDPDGVYLPDQGWLPPSEPLRPGRENLAVSDRWVIFARPRSDSFVLRDIERLKAAIDRQAAAGQVLPGAARILVLGPGNEKPAGMSYALSSTLGRAIEPGPAPDDTSQDGGDLFFPLPFNADQIEIVRRLERSDGVVVQGPPGTGKTHTIANIICHYLALGMRVLVVSHGEAALAVLRDKLPPSMRDLAISLTATDKEGLRQAETAVRRLQSIVETVKPHEQARLIGTLERDLLSCRERIAAIDDQVNEIARRNLEPLPGSDDRPFDLAHRLMAERPAHAWFEDRPTRLLSETNLSTSQLNAARAARLRLAEDLKHIDDVLPPVAELPDGAVLARLHEDLKKAAALSSVDDAAGRLAHRTVTGLGIEGAERLAANLQALLAGYRKIAEEPWLEPLSPLGGRTGAAAPDEVAAIIAFGRDVSRQLSWRPAFLARPVEAPADAFLQAEVIEIVERLAAGRKVFTTFALREKKLRPVVEAIRLNGFAPANPAEWAQVRDYLGWRRELHALEARWRSLAFELGAPPQVAAPQAAAPQATAPQATAGHSIRALENVARSVEVAISAAATAKRKVVQICDADLSMSRTDTETLIGDRRRLADLATAVDNRIAAAKLERSRAELNRLERLFAGPGVLPSSIRVDFLSGIGEGDTDPDRIETLWTATRERIRSLNDSRADFELIERASRAVAEAGAPALGKRLRTDPASADGDPVLAADWDKAWDWAARMHQLGHLGQRQTLQRLSDERRVLETRLCELFEAVVAARTHLGLSQTMSGPVKQALTAFMIALRRMGVTGRGPTANRHRRVAREALHGCYAGIPCWIMPSWRVAEQLPAELGGFDLVVVDEASQSDVRELTALLRGQKVLVVGDDKQVSPVVIGIENDKIERLEHSFLRAVPRTVRPFLLPGSSLYDLAKVMFPDKLIILKEHFRCVEPIIRFSTQFYDERLIPLRVPTSKERLDPPLIDIHVRDGRRRTGQKVNDREAEVIVDEIAQIVNDPALARFPGTHQHRSIGVISLIGHQQAALINKRLIEDPRIGEVAVLRHRIACGDSATFQGNERDIVFLSMVADPITRVAQTASHYMQRFNVAMSRARDRLVLVRSVSDEILNPRDLKAKVIRHFRDPFAGEPSSAEDRAGDLMARCESEFERDMLRRLVDKGFRVRPQVGALGYRIDLVVEDEDDRRLAIECDGDRHHGPERWAEDMQRQRVLERVGWRFRRYWASDFVLDPEGCMADLVETLGRLGIAPKSRADGSWTDRTFTQHRSVGEPAAAEAQRDAGLGELDRLPGRAFAVEAIRRSPTAMTWRRSAIADESLPRLAAPGPVMEGVAVELAAGERSIRIGDRVTIQFLDEPSSRMVTYLISTEATDETRGVLKIGSPLGQALLHAAVEDEVEFESDGRSRHAIVLAIHPPLLLAAE